MYCILTLNECFFCYRLTRVDLDKGPLNELLLLLYLNFVLIYACCKAYILYNDSEMKVHCLSENLLIVVVRN